MSPVSRIAEALCVAWMSHSNSITVPSRYVFGSKKDETTDPSFGYEDGVSLAVVGHSASIIHEHARMIS